jgi:hypothetical protein
LSERIFGYSIKRLAFLLLLALQKALGLQLALVLQLEQEQLLF